MAQPDAPRSRDAGPKSWPVRVVGRAVRALLRLLVGTGTALLAIMVTALVLAVAALCLVGVGLLLVRPTLWAVRWLTNLERSRLTWLGPAMVNPYLGPVPADWRAACRSVVADPTVRRDLLWLPVHASLGLVIGLLGLSMPSNGLREATFPAWWRLAPDSERTGMQGLIEASTWAEAWLIMLVGLAGLAVFVTMTPWFVTWQAYPGRRLLAPHPEVDLSARVAELTATRAAALDAHVAELRRIERALHDGAQNRLVGVAVLTGAARQALTRDPDTADAILGRVQTATEEALAELRAVVRGILPPILQNRGLAGALQALAAQCPVPCRVEIDVAVRCAASVEVTAYFAVAEALTNVAKHSRATRAAVSVRRVGDRLLISVSDDGRGGADSASGSGISGVADRVSAHDGTVSLSSPVGGPTNLEVELPCGS